MTARMRFERDYYGLMGLGANATDEEIRKAYRRLALRWHPDRNPSDPHAADRFREISEAYAVLIDPTRRRMYDRARATGDTGGFQPRREDLFRDLFADPRASAVFEELAREFARLGLRIDHRSFQQTLFGGRTVVTGGVIIITPFTPVLGLVRLARAALRAATRLSTVERPAAPPRAGSSVLTNVGRLARWFLGVPAPSIPPSATPAPEDVVIPLRLSRAEADRGGGKRIALGPGGSDEIVVTVPASIRHGTRLRLRGRGLPRADGSRGDVYLAVEVQ